ncbi:hypothetical protein K7X08_027297 [Anisodus acutangulus]|uniref:P-type ATPase A domain-containing protein n=1 Tax=Anisodus acutangulus TaxID=402998 RepID=A0A9Q1MP20_9SOLA|nr:hypothetical protein K7X08_027297 [Anisodus acutangulus]
MGDIVPADARILESTTDPVVKIDQSDLTGESLPVTKSPGDFVYFGSTCQQGEIIKAIVIATGVHNRYRNAATAHVVDSSNQVECFRNVSKGIGNFCIHFVAVVMMVEIIVMYCIQNRTYRSGIDNLLVLLIGGIPIGMPTILLLIMRRGAYSLSHAGMLDVQRDLIEVFANDSNKDTVALMAARACKWERLASGPGNSLLLPHCPNDKQTSHTYFDGEGKMRRVSIGEAEHILNHYAHNKL